MIKRHLHKIILVSILVIFALNIAAQPAMAQSVAEDIAGGVGSYLNFVGGPVTKTLFLVVSSWSSIILLILSWILSLAGMLLNVGMYFTTHLGMFIDESEVIYSVWKIIRDISSLFLIFLILWAAINMILSRQQTNFGELIKNIIILGILINFSFFFTRVMIDGSNIVSLQLYNALAPGNAASIKGTNIKEITAGIIESGSGGISDIIMGSLHINQWWQNRGQLTSGWFDSGGNIDATVRILLVTVTAAIVVVVTSLSFLAAAAACIWRIGVLLMLLAFSPLWIAGMALPKLGDFTKMWTTHLKAQLIFLPVYLLLMYVVIRILTESGLKNFTDNIGSLGGGVATGYINLFIGAAIVLFIINMPLITALSIAGSSGGWTQKMFENMKGWTQKRLGSYGSYREIGKGAWKETGSRVASRVARSESFQGFAAKNWFGEQALKGTRVAAQDYNKKLEEKLKSRQDFAQSLDRNKQAKADYASRLSTSIPAKLSMFGNIVGRADRVAAAKILRARLAEVKSELDKLTSEMNKHQKKARTTTLNAYEQERLDLLTGTNVSNTNPGPNNPNQTPKNEIQDEQNNKTDIENQLATFEGTVGASGRDVEKRQF